MSHPGYLPGLLWLEAILAKELLPYLLSVGSDIKNMKILTVKNVHSKHLVIY